MPWSLDIHTLDVGVGEASLIIAFNPEVNVLRSILIDGGLSAVAPLVHNAVTDLLPPGTGPDIILVTHYDKDHAGGVRDLMLADNLTAVVQELTDTVEGYADEPAMLGNYALVARRVAYAVFAAMRGAWGPDADVAEQAVLKLMAKAGETYEAAAAAAVAQALSYGEKYPFGTKPLFPKTQKYQKVAEQAGLQAANAAAGGESIIHAIHGALFTGLESLVPANARFQTGGLYNEALIVDIGDMDSADSLYAPAVQGALQQGTAHGALMPGVDRRRTGPPALGAELFWDGEAPPAPGAPYAVVVSGPHGATAGEVWQGDEEPETVSSGDKRNQQSIGLVIRFNDFHFFTAGDLPSQGEDPLSTALVNNPLPCGPNQWLAQPPPPPPLVAFKCGHHGAKASTSAAMLATLRPFTAYISCGDNKTFKHPSPDALQRLYDAGTWVYLTNCRFKRDRVVASPAVDLGPPRLAGSVNQAIAGNTAFIAGDNAVNNMAPTRLRGHILTRVLEESSHGAGRCYATAYFDNYPAPATDGTVWPGGLAVHQRYW